MDTTDLLDVVPTKAALLKKTSADDFKATVFETYKSNKSKLDTADDNKASSTRGNEKQDVAHLERDGKGNSKLKDVEFDIKRARHEVFNFALSGFRNKGKKKTEITLAMKLGAKAPKKAAKNYKELLDEKRRLKEIREERKKFHQLGKNQTGAASVKCKGRPAKKQQKPPIAQISKHYGVVNPKLKRK